MKNGAKTAQLSRLFRAMRRRIFVNCWHLSAYESAALWATYGAGGGIAVRSTFERMRRSFRGPADVFIGRVKYVDYDSYPIPEGSAFYPALHKRKSFEFEREIRAVCWDVASGGVPGPMPEPPDPGLSVPVDVSALIENVYVSPLAPDWLQRLVDQEIWGGRARDQKRPSTVAGVLMRNVRGGRRELHQERTQ